MQSTGSHGSFDCRGKFNFIKTFKMKSFEIIGSIFFQLGVQIIMFSKVPLQHPTMQQGLLFVHNGRGYPHNH